MGRARKGTGLAGSEMYSSNAASLPFCASKVNFKPSLKERGVGRTVHPFSQPDGHEGRRRHTFVPLSNATTGGTSALGALSLRYWSRNGRKISRRKVSAVSLLNFRAPRVLPSRISCP